MKAIILAGGRGIRLRPVTFLIPKPLLAIGDKPILEIIIAKLKKYGIKEFVFATGYKGELIETYFRNGEQWKVRIRYIREKKPLGTAGIMANLPKGYIGKNESFILMNGDIVTNLNFKKLVNFHNDNGFDITVAFKKVRQKSPYGTIEYADGRLLRIREKPTTIFNVSSGIYVISQRAARLVGKSRFYTMPELITDAMNSGMDVGVYNIKEYWLGIEQIGHFRQAHAYKDKWR